jgi:biotin operon repressor
MVDSRVIALAEAYLRGKDKSIKERLQKLQPKVEPAKFEDEKPKAEKPKKEIKPVSEKPKRATDSTKEVDRFGNGVNTQVAKINACLNGKPRTAQHIADELNCKVNSVRAHMQTLMGRGFVERVGDGYQVVTESK